MALASVKQLLADTLKVSPDQLEDWGRSWRVAVEGGSTESFFAFICRERGVAEDVFLQELARTLKYPFLDLPKVNVPTEARNKISTKVAFQYLALPTAFDNGVLQVCVSNPFDADMLSAVQFDAGLPISLALAPRAEIEKALKKYYGVGAETLDELNKEEEPLELDLIGDKEITEDDQEASVIKFVNQIIWEAFKDRATDIHFEPAEDELRIRYRIDGILHQTPMPPQLKRFQAALISRIKVMSGMNIAEKRLPQDGRINVRIKGEELDIRVSTVPTVYGESVSLRLLTRGKIFLTLDKLGFSPEEEAAIREIIVKPHGIMLVTGPTGSGKSTSLYAFLASINSVTKRIITIEEPVEYELKGINQIAVRPDIGLTFAVGLRHILRQDPNVIMVGEIRDLEPFLVASSVEAVLAQRLVRTICPHCKVEQKLEKDYLRRIGFPEEQIDTARFWKGAGCEECRQLGYQGRTGIYELLVVSEPLRPLIMSRAPATTIAQKAMELGMHTLRHDGWKKVAQGVTTIEEVLRVTQTEEHLSLIDDELRPKK